MSTGALAEGSDSSVFWRPKLALPRPSTLLSDIDLGIRH